MKLYSRLACSQKHQKCKFGPRLLSMIVGLLRRVRVVQFNFIVPLSTHVYT